jgi:hypothetical protein
MTKEEFRISREKHLDHMVRVVPLLVLAYGIQCYFIMSHGPEEFAKNGLFLLGACLVLMILGFITYDLTHVVNFSKDQLTISVSWLRYAKEIYYQEIKSIHVSDPGSNFSTLQIETIRGKKYGFYFVDDADKIKEWVEQKKKQSQPQEFNTAA